MKFDSNRAWKEASAAIAANREVLLALAGVFILLPSLAFALLLPAPEAQPGATPEQAMLVARGYYLSAAPYMIPMMIVQAIGTLSLLALFTDTRRPTVGEAIKLGAVGLLSYVGAQLLQVIGMTVVATVLVGIAAVTKISALVFIVIVLCVVGMLYISIKTSLAAPVIIVERVANPVTALVRSWRLTKGNSLRLGLFYLLLGVVFVIIVAIVSAVIGLVATLVVGGEAAKVLGAVVSSLLGSVFALYFVAAIAAAHRQLAGPSPDRVSATFD